MRFKLDENLPVELLDDLRAAGHEADGLPDEGLIGAPDARAAGYEVALDDFVDQPGNAALVPLANVLKIDFLATSSGERKRIADRSRRQKIALLAEKVETAATCV